MTYLLTLVVAMAISIAVIPLMVRAAPRLRMMDVPDPRKVHMLPVPRVGGIGIVIGTLASIVLWLPINEIMQAYLFGALVLFLFGAWDDARPLSPQIKFIGQLVAALAVVYYGDLYITQLPFVDLDAMSGLIGKPFTVFAIVGMINAVNTSDGLDGLAGGLSLLSLGCIGYLAVLSDDIVAISLVLATVGGVFGFLRYNTHPARVFMGDAGSQFLGFTLGVLAVLLTQVDNRALSPALPLLFLGLPVVDLLVVIVGRYRRGAKWYRPHKDHVHHRLMQLGFHHHEAVVIIYTVQCLLVVSAIFLMYEADWLIIGVYLAICLSLFMFLIIAEWKGWHAHSVPAISRVSSAVQAIKRSTLVANAPVLFVAVGVPAYFVFVSVSIDTVPRDFGVVSVLLATALFIYLMFGKNKDSIVIQAVNYATCAFTVYLSAKFLLPRNPAFGMTAIWYFSILALAVTLTVRYASHVQFNITPMDYLVVFIVVAAGILLQMRPEKTGLGLLAVETVVLFYAYELIIARTKRVWNPQNIATMAALVILGAKGVT